MGKTIFDYLETVRDAKKIKYHDIDKRLGYKFSQKIKTRNGKRLSLIIDYTRVLGFNLLGMFEEDKLYTIMTTDMIRDKISAYVVNLYYDRVHNPIADLRIKPLKKYTTIIEKLRTRVDITVTDFETIMKILNIDTKEFADNLITKSPIVQDTYVASICKVISEKLKEKRLKSGIKISDINIRGNISETTARRIEYDCSHVGIRKVIIYSSILGFDIMQLLNNRSTSYDPDVRVIDFYNSLGSYRLAQEIPIHTIALQLHMSDEKVQRCETYRANMSMFTAIKWLELLNVLSPIDTIRRL